MTTAWNERIRLANLISGYGNENEASSAVANWCFILFYPSRPTADR